MQVSNFIGSLQIDENTKLTIVSLIQDECVSGATFCKFDSVETIEREFGVKFLLCDRRAIRNALANNIVK